MKLVQAKVTHKGKLLKTKYNLRDLRGLFLAAASYYEVEVNEVRVVPQPPSSEAYLARGTRNRDGSILILNLADADRYIKSLSAVDRLAAEADDGWLPIPQEDFDDLCGLVAWLIAETKATDWAEGRQLRYKVPKAKVKATGADYHQQEIEKLQAQVERWKANKRKAEMNVARIERGIKAREKKIKYHTKQRDKKEGTAK